MAWGGGSSSPRAFPLPPPTLQCFTSPRIYPFRLLLPSFSSPIISVTVLHILGGGGSTILRLTARRNGGWWWCDVKLFTTRIHIWGFSVLGLTARCCLSWWSSVRLLQIYVSRVFKGSIGGVELAVGGCGGGCVVVVFSVLFLCFVVCGRAAARLVVREVSVLFQGFDV